jgi:hypothetical protein
MCCVEYLLVCGYALQLAILCQLMHAAPKAVLFPQRRHPSSVWGLCQHLNGACMDARSRLHMARMLPIL